MILRVCGWKLTLTRRITPDCYWTSCPEIPLFHTLLVFVFPTHSLVYFWVFQLVCFLAVLWLEQRARQRSISRGRRCWFDCTNIGTENISLSEAAKRLDQGVVYFTNIALLHGADVTAMQSATTRTAIPAQFSWNSICLNKVFRQTSTANRIKNGKRLRHWYKVTDGRTDAHSLSVM